MERCGRFNDPRTCDFFGGEGLKRIQVKESSPAPHKVRWKRSSSLQLALLANVS